MRQNLHDLPADLPQPVDDGKAGHLAGLQIPHIKLQSTQGLLDLHHQFQEPSVLFIYPRAGSPLEAKVDPELWDSIPGARGCTPQSCGFRDLIGEFKNLGINIFGLSIQTPAVQAEFVERNHISFPVLSDCKYEFADLLNLPTFEFTGERLIKRMAFYIEDAKIKKVFYPVFPPDKNAEEVLAWLRSGQ